VVGRAIRQTGSRPLLLAEVLEHWELVLDTCLTRWSLEQGCSRAELQEQVRRAYLDAERAYAAAGGSSSSSSSEGSGGEGAGGGSPAGSAAAMAAGCRTAVQAINECGALVYIASCHPAALSRQLLGASRLDTRRAATLVQAPSLAGAVGHVLGLQDAGDTLHVVVDGPRKAQRLMRQLREEREARGGGAQVRVYVAEWTCTAPSLRAKALGHGEALGLLAEHGLAQLLGVEHVRAVMDGVAWR
jgi:hypothetical protein